MTCVSIAVVNCWPKLFHISILCIYWHTCTVYIMPENRGGLWDRSSLSSGNQGMKDRTKYYSPDIHLLLPQMLEFAFQGFKLFLGRIPRPQWSCPPAHFRCRWLYPSLNMFLYIKQQQSKCNTWRRAFIVTCGIPLSVFRSLHSYVYMYMFLWLNKEYVLQNLEFISCNQLYNNAW